MQEHLPYAGHYCTYHSYIHPRHRKARFQYLHTVILSSFLSRSSLSVPTALSSGEFVPSHPGISRLLPLYPFLPIKRSMAVRDYYTRISPPGVGSWRSSAEITYHEISEPNLAWLDASHGCQATAGNVRMPTGGPIVPSRTFPTPATPSPPNSSYPHAYQCDTPVQPP
jgi:hypothetical protein